MHTGFKILIGGSIGLLIAMATERLPSEYVSNVQFALEVVAAFIIGVWILIYFGFIDKSTFEEED